MATGRIGTTPVLQVRWSKAPSAGTTSLSGLDDNSVSLVYSVGYEAVYRNGVLLSRTNDYTATDGTTITLIDATIAGDIIEVFANQTIPLADTYSQTVANGKFINNTLTTTTGDIIYASAANTPARLGIGSTDQVLKVSGGIPAWGAAPAAGFKGCYARITAAQTLSNATETALNFGGERFDTNGFHDNSVNNTRITIPAGLGGYYLIMGMQSLEDMATNNNYRLNIRVNAGMGTAYSGSYSGGDKLTLGFTNPILNLSAGDYIEMYAYQNSGGSVNTVYDPNYDFGTFIVQYLGA